MSSKTTDDATMTPEQIVEALRNGDGKAMQKALDAIDTEKGNGLLLIRAGKMSVQTAGTTRFVANVLFPALLFAAQNVGAQLGLQLNWIQTMQDENKLMLPPGLVK